MKLSQFKFDLPLNLIAQHPAKKREDARMMVVHRKTGQIENKHFRDILEYFDDKDGASAGAFNASIFATTLSANFKIDNLTIIPEFRYENASNPIYLNSAGDGTKSTSTVLVAATYKF